MCPYETWRRGHFIFCEAQRCGWIRQPLDTYSNLGFLLVGLYLFQKNRCLAQLRLIGLSAILVGVLSAFYHATDSYLGEVLDLGSMYLLTGTLCFFNLNRLGAVTERVSEIGAVAASSLGMLALCFDPSLGRPLFAASLDLTVLLELAIYLKGKSLGASYRWFWLALACHLTAFACWWLDKEKILCQPTSLLFQGHAVWHLLQAGTFICVNRFYAQFVRSRTLPRLSPSSVLSPTRHPTGAQQRDR